MLGRELGRTPGVERRLPREQFGIHHGQAELIAEFAGPALENFRRGITGRHAVQQRGVALGQILHQSEIAELEPPAHQQQVFGLDVQMLQRLRFR